MRAVGSIAVFLSLLPTNVGAAPSSEAGAVERPPTPIVDGDAAPNCAWPSVVRLEIEDGRMRCSGSLVHPYIVATAAHCLFLDDPITRVRFGEDEDNLAELAEVVECVPNPAFVNGPDGADFDNTDFAFCLLADPVETVPVIPIAYGCELDQVQPGAPIAMAGFGVTNFGNDDHGSKRFGYGSILSIDEDGEILATPLSCNGDSGTALFMQIADGTLRQIGINSHSAYCAEYAATTAAAQLVALVAETTGIDIAPCHSSDGEWSPTGWCGGVPLEPHVGGRGTYDDGCPSGARSGFLDSCGPAVDSTPDAQAPTVTVIEPADGDSVRSGSKASVSVLVEADDADGWGVATVDIVIEDEDDMQQRHTRGTPPYDWQLALPTGGYYLRAEARDFADNMSASEWIAFGVGVAAPPPMDDDEDTSSSSGSTSDAPDPTPTTTNTTADDSDGSTSETSADAPPAPRAADAEGCSCRSSSPRGAAVFALLVFLGWRRFPSRRWLHRTR